VLTGRVAVLSQVLTVPQDGFPENAGDLCFWASVTSHSLLLDFLVSVAQSVKILKNELRTRLLNNAGKSEGHWRLSDVPAVYIQMP
jgi:hypothetical protein